MAYMLKQQFNISDLAAVSEAAVSVLVAEPEFYLARLAGRYLNQSGFTVRYCWQLPLLRQHLALVSPAALLLNPQSYRGLAEAVRDIAAVNGEFPRLRIVTISHNLEHADLRRLLDAGVTGHINRQLSRPADVADIIKGLL